MKSLMWKYGDFAFTLADCYTELFRVDAVVLTESKTTTGKSRVQETEGKTPR